MLQGLDVEDNLLPENTPDRYELEILYEDQWLLIVNKPAGMLSVPGKSSQASVCQLLQKHHPALTGLTTVHRLDMATSGLLLIAKTKDIHYHLQRQFKNRTIKKSYVAILDGNIDSDEGIIELPLCLDPWDRPRQIVSPEHGKPSVTRYRVVEHNANRTRIVFYPLTGQNPPTTCPCCPSAWLKHAYPGRHLVRPGSRTPLPSRRKSRIPASRIS